MLIFACALYTQNFVLFLKKNLTACKFYFLLWPLCQAKEPSLLLYAFAWVLNLNIIWRIKACLAIVVFFCQKSVHLVFELVWRFSELILKLRVPVTRPDNENGYLVPNFCYPTQPMTYVVHVFKDCWWQKCEILKISLHLLSAK